LGIAASNASGVIRFYTGGGNAGNERLRIASSGELLTGGKTTVTANGGDVQVSSGISFPVTQVAKSDPNTLDDYEEGNWTPILSDGTNDGTQGADNGGAYVKIGRQVFFTAQFAVGDIQSVGADCHIKGLPFTSVASTRTRSGVAIGFGNQLNLAAAGRVVTGYVELNNQYIRLFQWSATTGTSSVSGAEISNNGNLYLSGHYYV
jgi:hypothetical protein